MSKKIIRIVSILMLCLLLTGCFPASEKFESEPAGFLMGVWHGWIAPISLIMGFVNGGETRVYEVNNSGIIYDLGFYMAVIAGFGGLALLRRKKKG